MTKKNNGDNGTWIQTDTGRISSVLSSWAKICQLQAV